MSRYRQDASIPGTCIPVRFSSLERTELFWTLTCTTFEFLCRMCEVVVKLLKCRLAKQASTSLIDERIIMLFDT
jgi:hypothetical protein